MAGLQMEHIAQLIADAGLGVPQKSLFVFSMPSGVDEGIMVINRLAGETIDWSMPVWQRDSFQVVVRSKTIPTGRALIDKIAKALTFHDWRDLTCSIVPNIDPVSVHFIRPRHAPIVYPRSTAGDVIEFSVNFDFGGQTNN